MKKPITKTLSSEPGCKTYVSANNSNGKLFIQVYQGGETERAESVTLDVNDIKQLIAIVKDNGYDL